MVEEKLEPEVKEILELIGKKKNFLLSGGAGSGKTYSLVQVIKAIIKVNPTSKVACMTYTNAAVREIEERVNHENLSVSTIHDFLWDNIKTFQKELKKGLIALLNDINSKVKNPDDTIIDDSYFDGLENGIQYKEYNRIKEGIISHDEVLELSNYMFKTHKLLCDILKDKFNYIFIDEYQDTNPLVIEIFLEHFNKSKKKCVIGCFGDAMQAIYEDGIGDLKTYVNSGVITDVPKKQNRRNPQLVISLANKLRTDGLIQEPSKDINAPNMLDEKVKVGNIKFLYSLTDVDLKDIRATTYFKDWDFNDPKKTKELNLTHNLIAPKAGFSGLMEIYNRDRIIELKNQIVKKIKEEKIEISDKETFGDVIDKVNYRQTPAISSFLRDNPLLYGEARMYLFTEFRNIYLSSDILVDDKKQDKDEESKKGSKRDNLIKHLFKIQEHIHLYKNNQYNELIRRTEYPIKRVQDKIDLKNTIDTLESMSNKTIEEVIDLADEKGICLKDDKFNQFTKNNQYVYNRVKKVEFREFQNLYDYLEGFTPFSTQHKTKGTEFDNVFVVLDNGGWNNYNFGYLFNNQTDKATVLSRTQKIFYVCCTRTKENLVVFYHKPSPSTISIAGQWFGNENVHPIGNN